MPTLPRWYDTLRAEVPTYTWTNPRLKSMAPGPFPHNPDTYISPIIASHHDSQHSRRAAGDPSKALYTALQKHIIQTTSTATSALTLVATLITFYWFYKMQKRFRHKLITMSILGCFIRGLFYFVFSILSMGNMPIATASSLCQVSGFFIQLGNEITDFSTLFIAIHGALQIFRPAIGDFDSGDGLDHYRNYVFATVILLPILMASLAFSNPEFPYIVQGAFCGLPTKPIWWRLGLAWIPRFMIAFIVTALALSVYVYVEWKFHAFSRALRRASTMSMSAADQLQPSLRVVGSNLNIDGVQERRESRPSLPSSLRLPNFSRSQASALDTIEIHSPKEVRILVNDEPAQASKEYFPNLAHRKQSVATTSTTLTSISENEKSSSSSKPSTGLLQPGGMDGANSDTVPAVVPSSAEDSLTPPRDSSLASFESPNSVRRRQLRRQLRLIFIYPIVYVVLWVPPMVLNMMQLTSTYQQKLPSSLAIISTVCVMLMGLVDCLCFLWREKPWRRGAHPCNLVPAVIKKSSCFGRKKHDGDDDVEAARNLSIRSAGAGVIDGNAFAMDPARQSSQDTLNPLSPRFAIPRPKFVSKSSNESKSRARELAYQRLALERGAALGSEPRESIGSQQPAADGDGSRNASLGSTARKEWWD